LPAAARARLTEATLTDGSNDKIGAIVAAAAATLLERHCDKSGLAGMAGDLDVDH
jgi:hypothetical protein